jgi:HK97 gp10 family phage protein
LTAEVSANASYAAYLEFGTRKMRAQPYLRPAGDNSRRDVERIFQRNLRAVK